MSVFEEIEAKGPGEIAACKRRVLQACLQMFEIIAARAREICKCYNLSITTFVLTIPANWKMEVEDYYRHLIVKSFNPAAEVEILLILEVEALANYLFHDDYACQTIVNDLLNTQTECKFLVVDFGGFTCVGIARYLCFFPHQPGLLPLHVS